MIELKTLGLQLLNSTISRVAEHSEDGEEMEQSISVLETCKKLICSPKLRLALSETAESHDDKLRRERDVTRSLMEADFVRMM